MHMSVRAREPILNIRPMFALVALVAADGSAYAQRAGNAALSREDVVQRVLEARAKGALRRAGETGPRGDDAYAADVGAAPTLTRAQQRALVLQARSARELAHAGPIAPGEETARANPPTAARTRAEVQQEVLEAFADGTLTAGGAGQFPDVPGAYRRWTFASSPPVADRSVATRDK